MDDEQHVDNLIDAYALGALEDAELAEVEAHLAHCSRCQELARAARASAQSLLFDVPLVEPPASLRRRVLARVHQEAVAHQPATQPGPQPAVGQDVAAAASGLAGGQGPSGLGRWLRSLRREQAAPDDAIAAQLARLMSDPDCQVWQLAGTDDAPGASARLVGTLAGREGILLAAGLRALPPDHAYQVWFLRSGQPIPNALFRVAQSGQGRQIVRAPANLGEDLVIAVTPEPAGGSPAPTGHIVLMGQITA